MLSALFAPLLKYVSGGLLFLTLMLAVAWQVELRHARKSDRRIIELTELRKADRASYEAAQIQAEEKNRADVRAKEEQYKRNNDEAVGNLNARIERLRRELRALPGAASGSAGGSSLPQAHDSPGAPGQAGVCLAPEELLRGAENEERFDQLITLILKQTR